MVPFYCDQEKKKNDNMTFLLKCYSLNFIEKFSNSKGNKILMPGSVLKNINHYDIKWPLTFKITNISSKKHTHCGVLEFTSDENCAYLPYWMIKNLSTSEGQLLLFEYTNLEKGNYVKIQPQTNEFLEIFNPKAVLEANLRAFTCLTKKDVIAIDYNNKIYWLNIIEVKPGNAISITETDINVDFSTPMLINDKEKNRDNTSIVNKKIQNYTKEESEETSL